MAAKSAEEEKCVAGLLHTLHSFYTDEGRKKGLGVEHRPGDVFICTAPKAGTTWMQQICHQLRTGGDMTFGEISDVVPWLETCEDLGIDVDAPQVAAPRLFKTHAWRPHLHTSKDAKYIVITRNPEDSAVSFYNFLNGWFFEKDSISMDTFLQRLFLKRGKPQSIMNNPSYWEFLVSWWPHRNDPNLLWLWYEDMKVDHKEVVAKVAKFIGFDLKQKTPGGEEGEEEGLIEMATRMSTFDFMKEHEKHFDEHNWKSKRNAACGLPPEAGLKSSKVMNGGREPRATLSKSMKEALDAKWQEVVKPVTGCDNYEELRKRNLK